MCLIAYSPKGVLVDRAILAYAYYQNPDGIGIMSSAGIEKFMGKKALKRARRYLETYLVPKGVPYAIHFRWATHGDVKMVNTHPYESPQGTHWIMHNGVLGVTSGEATADESDTAVYVRKYLHEAPGFDDKQYWDTVSTHIGWGNKFCVMDANGEFRLCNDDAGEWIGGIWFSNTYSLPDNVIPKRQSYTYGGAYSGLGGYYATRSEYKPVPYQSAYGYTNALGTWVPKDFWDSTEKKMCSNPAYKESEHYPDRVKFADVHYTTADKTRIDEMDDDGGTCVLELNPNERWSSEDRRSYYESLEHGLTADDDSYHDTGTQAALAKEDEDLQMTQPLLSYVVDKPDAPIGGDFAEPDPADETDEDQSKFRTYLKAVAAGIYTA